VTPKPAEAPVRNLFTRSSRTSTTVAATSSLEVFTAAAGGAAHLAGVIAAKTLVPVLGVPMESKLQGLDSLLSMVQMPAGIPVGTLAIGKAGATNAALLGAGCFCLLAPEVTGERSEVEGIGWCNPEVAHQPKVYPPRRVQFRVADRADFPAARR
jgi:AIR carboxylase